VAQLEPKPQPSQISGQSNTAQKCQCLRKALEDHEPKLRDAAQAFVYALGLARDPFQVAELVKEAVQYVA
jgi:hypothetical protein